ncbi:MAG: gamma-butyrobetaine hydroxylase-like domain-containing protein [Myxococcota bacterium]
MQPSPFDTVEPVDLRWNTDGSVGITWDDSHESTFDLAFLRSRCPCATCKGTHGPPTTLVKDARRAGRTEPSSEVQSVEPVGQYAIRFKWGDGHDAGLYSYRYLRVICPCAACEAERTAQA